MQARLEQDLIGVDVADARHQHLVHEHRLDVAAAPFNGAVECLEIERRVEGVPPELLGSDEFIGVICKPDPPEHAAVDIGQMPAAFEVEAHAVVWGIVGVLSKIDETAGHSEVQRQPAISAQPDQKMLAVASRSLEAIAGQLGYEGLDREITQYSRIFD